MILTPSSTRMPCALGFFAVALMICAPAHSQGYQVLVVPPEPIPIIPAGDDIIVYVHGGPDSRLEEAADMAVPLIQAGNNIGKHFTIISFDQPSQGYSRMIEPTAIVPTPDQASGYYPLVAFSDDFVAALINQLSVSLPLAGRNIYVIGGSTGGAITLRLGRPRVDAPWLKKIVAWNAASVWASYTGGPDDFWNPLKQYIAGQGFGRSIEPEIVDTGGGDDSRAKYFTGVFAPPIPGFQWNLHIQPNPEEWYRGNRDTYKSDSDTPQPFRMPWKCKFAYIGDARFEQQEIYNEMLRKWHWRLGTEVLSYSILNDSWIGKAHTAPHDGVSPLYQQVTTPLLLVASDDDNWNEGWVAPGDSIAFGAALGSDLGPLGAAFGAAVGAITGPVFFHWEDRWDQTQFLINNMTHTRGYFLNYNNTGHSIHNERPRRFANDIARFLADTTGLPPPLKQWGTPYSVAPPWPDDEDCLPGKLFAPDPHIGQDGLLAAPASATRLLETAIPGGNFSDNSPPGAYSLRLRPELSNVAVLKNPNFALARAAEAFHSSATIWGNAYADLAVTGRDAYAKFQSNPPTPTSVAALLGNQPGPQWTAYSACYNACQTCTWVVPPRNSNVAPHQSCTYNTACQAACRQQYPTGVVGPLQDPSWAAAINAALTRAYQVAWALRRPDIVASYTLRQQNLGWIAVSGEDDPPARPVNVPSGIPFKNPSGVQIASYPQYDFTVWMCGSLDPNGNWVAPYEPSSCQQGVAGAVPFTIRYTIVSSFFIPAGALTPAPTVVQLAAPAAIARAPVSAITAPIRPIAVTRVLPPMSATLCWTANGRTCLLPNAPVPLPGQSRAVLVSVSAAGRAVVGADVAVSGQAASAVTDGRGVAIITYLGCAANQGGAVTSSPTPVPCVGTASMAGYAPLPLSLP